MREAPIICTVTKPDTPWEKEEKTAASSSCKPATVTAEARVLICYDYSKELACVNRTLKRVET